MNEDVYIPYENFGDFPAIVMWSFFGGYSTNHASNQKKHTIFLTAGTIIGISGANTPEV